MKFHATLEWSNTMFRLTRLMFRLETAFECTVSSVVPAWFTHRSPHYAHYSRVKHCHETCAMTYQMDLAVPVGCHNNKRVGPFITALHLRGRRSGRDIVTGDTAATGWWVKRHGVTLAKTNMGWGGVGGLDVIWSRRSTWDMQTCLVSPESSSQNNITNGNGNKHCHG